MAEFNPDEYLAEKDKEAEFDPDEYLAEPDSELVSDIKDFSREAVKALPVIGSVAGGSLAAGAATIPSAGTLTSPAYLAGSAVGAGAGKALQTLIEENLLNEPKKSLEEKFTEIPKEVAYDVAGNVTGEKLIAPLAKGIGAGAKKVASSLSGVPEGLITNLSKNYEAVGKIDDVALEADRIRQAAQDSINQFKNVQNSRISKAISEKADLPIDISKTRQALVENLGKINHEINPDVAKKIQKEIDLIDNLSSRSSSYTEVPGTMQAEGYDVFTQPDLFKFSEKPTAGFNAPRGDDLYPLKQSMELGENTLKGITGEGYQGTITGAYSTKVPNNDILVPAKDAYQLQKRLQDLAEYLAPGQVFKKKDFADITFQRAAANTRQSLQRVVPEISQANAELGKIRRIDKNINKNLIVPEKPMNAMIGVGSGQNPMMQRQVEKLGAITGEDYLSPMQNLATAQKFNNPDIISALTTGRAGLPLLLGGSLAAGAGGGLKGAAAGLATGLIGTPVGIKTSIGAGQALGRMGVTPQKAASEAMQFYGPEIQQLIQDQMPQHPPLNPYQIDQKIKHDPSMTPSQKAKARLQNNKMNK